MSADPHTILSHFDTLKANQYTVGNTTWHERKAKLMALHTAITKTYKQEIITALKKDFNKLEEETILTEIYPIAKEIKTAVSNLQSWTANHSVKVPIALLGATSYIKYQPKGVCLIISPWNFPFNLTFCPLVSAIAAGNVVILKPSELTPNSSELMAKIIATVFASSEVVLINGGVETSTELLKLPFNHIFFTGSPTVGKIVMKAAAEHLTSVTLELGGKSPAIVDDTADIASAARKLVWGKFLNAGQICIAPDYLMVDEKVYHDFLSACQSELQKQFNNQASGTAIVNPKHLKRLVEYIDDALQKGAKISAGGQIDVYKNMMSPTILTDIKRDEMRVMQDEIFGPLLPVMPYKNLNDVVTFIQERERPLSLYMFSDSKNNIDFILNNTRAGGTCINHNLLHFSNANLPFGGTGNSGMGRSHGFRGFTEFSDTRGVFRQHTFGPIDLLIPPYTKWKKWLIDFTLKYL